MSFFGLCGGLVASIMIDMEIKHGKIPKYDVFLKVFSLLGFTFVIILAVLVNFWIDSPIWIIFIIMSIIGLALNAIAPVA